MPEKPHDMLEFFRRTTAEPAPPVEAPPSELEPTPRLFLVRRSQVVVAAAGVACALVLAFVLGMAAGSRDAPAVARGVGSWVIRVITFPADAAGRKRAESVQRALEERDLGEVTIQRLERDNQFVVTLGSWVSNPGRSVKARQLLDAVARMEIENAAGKPFKDALFWRIER